MNETVVIGVGNLLRGDDGFGLVVLNRLRQELGADVDYLESRGDVSQLLDAFRQYKKVYLIDALRAEGPVSVGKVHCLDAHAGHFKSVEFRGSSHVLGVAQAIEMARALGGLAPEVKIWGAEGQNFAMHLGLSQDMERAVEPVVNQIVSLIRGDKNA